jgi:hypothetical protein
MDQDPHPVTSQTQPLKPSQWVAIIKSQCPNLSFRRANLKHLLLRQSTSSVASTAVQFLQTWASGDSSLVAADHSLSSLKKYRVSISHTEGSMNKLSKFTLRLGHQLLKRQRIGLIWCTRVSRLGSFERRQRWMLVRPSLLRAVLSSLLCDSGFGDRWDWCGADSAMEDRFGRVEGELW